MGGGGKRVYGGGVVEENRAGARRGIIAANRPLFIFLRLTVSPTSGPSAKPHKH